jgi:Surface adhesin CshA non-repetitive domain 2
MWNFKQLPKPLVWLLRLVILCAGMMAAPAYAQSCSAATSQGTAPAGWQTYCWLDFATYNDTTARSSSGQNFSFTLSDGSVLSFNLRATSTAATAAVSTAAPSWTGAAVGNSAFLGIPGRPILYMANNGSTVNFNISSILITPPPGAPAVTAYAFVAADAESTDGNEQIVFGTNGGGWVELDRVNPISGNQYPTSSGIGSSTFTTTGGGQGGNVGGYIVGTNSPTAVTASMTGSGLQGMMFAVRFASIRLTKQITGARINAADQFTFRIAATSSGSTLATGTTTGTSNGPFTAAAVSLASGIPLTLTEAMAPGSVSAITQYSSRLTCINGSTSSTPLPNNLQTISHSFGALQFGDAVQCTFTNAAYPQIRLRKALGTGGRRFSTDQFTVTINQGTTVVASATTSGTTTTVTGGDTGLTPVTAGTTYTLDEVMSGPGSLSQYTKTLACANGTNGVTTSFPTNVPGNITPVLGDIITCTITNTRLAGNATLVVTKISAVLSDGVSATNPKAIAGARIQYTITVQNTGNLAVDANSIVITDPFPPEFTMDASTAMSMNVGTSGLAAFNQGTMVTYSSQASGGAPYTASLGTGYNGALTGLRFQPSGTMAAATAAGPSSFSFTFTGRID